MRRALSHHNNRLFLKNGYKCNFPMASPSAVRRSQPISQNQMIRSLSSSSRPDPFARRPNQICDPYGQGGKPLSLEDAQRLLTTVSDEWELNATTTSPTESSGDNNNREEMMIPTFLSREFSHADFMEGSSFLTHVAAVAQMNDHFPSLHLERRLDSRNKAWGVVSTVTCHTKVLQGLSHHDFFLATLIDVEIERPEVKSLLLLVSAEEQKNS